MAKCGSWERGSKSAAPRSSTGTRRFDRHKDGLEAMLEEGSARRLR